MEEMLIAAVRRHSCLYDVSCPDYRDGVVKQVAWEEVGSALGISGEKAKDNWEKLRRCFTNALNRRRGRGGGEAAKKYHPWKHQEEMSFLLPFLDVRAKRTRYSLEDLVNKHEETGVDLDDTDVANLKQEQSSEPGSSSWFLEDRSVGSSELEESRRRRAALEAAASTPPEAAQSLAHFLTCSLDAIRNPVRRIAVTKTIVDAVLDAQLEDVAEQRREGSASQ